MLTELGFHFAQGFLLFVQAPALELGFFLLVLADASLQLLFPFLQIGLLLFEFLFPQLEKFLFYPHTLEQLFKAYMFLAHQRTGEVYRGLWQFAFLGDLHRIAAAGLAHL